MPLTDFMSTLKWILEVLISSSNADKGTHQDYLCDIQKSFAFLQPDQKLYQLFQPIYTKKSLLINLCPIY